MEMHLRTRSQANKNQTATLRFSLRSFHGDRDVRDLVSAGCSSARDEYPLVVGYDPGVLMVERITIEPRAQTSRGGDCV